MTSASRLIYAIALLVPLAIGESSARAAGEESYRCPLLGPYCVRRGLANHEGAGLYQLVKSDGDFSFQYIVERVTKVAVSGVMIVGSTETGYFIFDTTQQFPEPRLFTDAHAWQDAMKSAGIPPGIQLNNPDDLAAKLPDRVVRPFQYLRMKGLFGLPDDAWAYLFFLVTAIAMFAHGALTPPGTSVLPLAILLGATITVIFIALGIIDLAAFLGFFIYPVPYWIIGKAGRLVRAFVFNRMSMSRVSPPEETETE